MLDVQFLGPPLEMGPLPAVFYFALSAQDSLHLDPFNQPALLFASTALRIFSITLPGHDLLPPTQALQFWADEIQKGTDVIGEFTRQVADYIYTLAAQSALRLEQTGFMGLSRGVFIACHVAARIQEIPFLLGFAPLTHLEFAEEFKQLSVEKWNLVHLADQLYNRKVRCYIGNHDTRVGTHHCFEFISALAKIAHQKQLRTSPLELIIGPSIGRQGHGTPPHIFKQGALWLEQHLLGGPHAP